MTPEGGTHKFEPPVFASPEFQLRVPLDSDAAEWFRLFDDAEVMRYISNGATQTLEWYVDFVARQQHLASTTGVCLFALTVLRPGSEAPDARRQVAGFVGLQPWSRPWGPVGRIEVGWRLGREFQGRGLATAGACAALALYRHRADLADSPRASDQPPADRTPIAMIDVRNTASMRVATKLGMSEREVFTAPDGVRAALWQ
ncbi:GNAT family N-acetyltransferase [Subtercola lobariae]|uniref:N-acetyltransferase n=1 Tax=Subtercola lobariae TaxID=1588641 RepID=A0A917EZ32_9MICO|nr:GNAT family N-acetyltransferase [Subtercola lobariae]GGF25330.1 N-acetyltransferase [Subtercola lobariae]